MVKGRVFGEAPTYIVPFEGPENLAENIYGGRELLNPDSAWNRAMHGQESLMPRFISTPLLISSHYIPSNIPPPSLLDH